MEDIVLILFLAGIILAILEVFVTGFGFFGIISIGCFIFSFIMTYFTDNALLNYFIEFAILGVFLLLLWFLVKKFNILNRLVNKDPVKLDKIEEKNHYIGCTGVTKSVLKPVGVITIEDISVEGIAVLGFIEKGVEVKVVRVTDGKLFVEKV